MNEDIELLEYFYDSSGDEQDQECHCSDCMKCVGVSWRDFL